MSDHTPTFAISPPQPKRFQGDPNRKGAGLSQELETAAAGSLGGFLRRGGKAAHASPPGTPCANCATPLQGPWCHACGQFGEDYHRSVWHLVVEVFEGLFHFDGRVWRTLPGLMIRPGQLTRAYLDGHRAPQIPPLRLFLVVLLAVFLTGSLGGKQNNMIVIASDDHGKVQAKHEGGLSDLTPEQKAEVRKALADRTGENAKPSAVRDWFRARLDKAMDDPERFKLAMEQWSERFAFLMLPLAAGLLSLLFVFQRQFFVFDHTIFSLHSLSAAGLIFSVSFLLKAMIGPLGDVVLLALPVHLFVHMRGVYGTSVIGALVRMALLFAFSLIGFGLIVSALVVTALNMLGA